MTPGRSRAAGTSEAALSLLVCPHCGAGLELTAERQVGCQAGHRFDVARQGYLPLLGARSRTDTGDDAAMVAVRAAFLGAGHYRPIADAVAVRATGAVLEIGAGTGYYLAATDPELGVAVDSSRFAARRAAAVHPRVLSVLADAWSPWPLRDDAVDTVLVVFAPRTPAEIARVLRPGGLAVVVTPLPEHLLEIRGVLGMLAVDPGKAEKVRETWWPMLTVVDGQPVVASLELGHDDLRALVAMGPAARHRTAEQIAADVAVLPPRVSVTLAVTVTTLRA